MAWWRSGRPNPRKREHARALLAAGEGQLALKLLTGSAYGAGYDLDYCELLGKALLECGQLENAGRFLFLSGSRTPNYQEAIKCFLARHHDPRNFRQLHSQFPMRMRVLWKLSQFPEPVREELRKLGFPEDIQSFFVERRLRRTRH